MKIYTKRGDDGGTDLFGGQRVRKDSLRVEAYGTVDELNSVLGLAVCACRFPDLAELLRQLQHQLFELGSELATPPAKAEGKAGPGIAAAHVRELEGQIDRLSGLLPAMRSFILPGGTELAARLHLARTVCRRAERVCVHLAGCEPVNEQAVIYLNRLSDLLFVMARRANQLESMADVPWPGMKV